MDLSIRAIIWHCGQQRVQNFLCQSLADAMRVFNSLKLCENVERLALHVHRHGTFGDTCEKVWEKT